MEQYTGHAILDDQICDMCIEYNLSLECHFHYIIHDLFSFDLPLILTLLSSESFDTFEPIKKPIIFFSPLLFYLHFVSI